MRKPLTKIILVDCVTIFLILITPFLNFVYDMEYKLYSPEILIIFLFFITLGLLLSLVSTDHLLVRCVVYTSLITLFIDVQFEFAQEWKKPALAVPIVAFIAIWAIRKHLSVILLTIFATMNVVTVVLAIEHTVEVFQFKKDNDGQGKSDLPVLVHLILDEHIGIEGIPLDIPGGIETRDALLSFYQRYDFRIFGATYSRYFTSNDSIAALLNFDQSLAPENLYEEKGSDSYVLTRNTYFQKMRSDGYRIKVYQPTYMDFCDERFVTAADCFSYNHYSISYAALTSLGVFERLWLIVRMYAKFSFSISEFLKFYEYMRSSLGQTGKVLPSWHEWDGRVSPIATMPVIDRLIADIETEPRGRLYFAHLLIPHFPYIYDQNCTIRTPLFNWKNPAVPKPTAQTRAIRYPLYFEQIHCTIARLRDLFERMKAAGRFEDATIIIHSDHGSRIGRTWLPHTDKGTLNAQDLMDGFSTLFAVKAPEHEAGYDGHTRSVTQTFQQVVYRSMYIPTLPEKHYVYLRTKDGSWSKIPFSIVPQIAH